MTMIEPKTTAGPCCTPPLRAAPLPFGAPSDLLYSAKPVGTLWVCGHGVAWVTRPKFSGPDLDVWRRAGRWAARRARRRVAQ